eukprot:TRINITY_DN1667_c1_g1_i2.p1 TRINITY_DN1667_c1_g1~~TRINITY_DN1667_c1_g1_i2.p1  ORF type:complete len:683 (+),score=40.71 TRINITY_DN1667_c1_g1_i2:1287-3335(+)
MAGGRPACWSRSEFVEQRQGQRKGARCKHCNTVLWSVNGQRLKQHLGGCDSVPAEKRDKAKAEIQKKRSRSDDAEDDREVVDVDAQAASAPAPPAPAPPGSPAAPAAPAPAAPATPATPGGDPPKKKSKPAAKPARQCRIVATPRPNETEMARIVDAWADFVLAAGLPLSIIEDEHFIKAVGVTRPGIDVKQLPSRHQLGGKLLDEKYDAVMKPRLQALHSAKHITVTCDVWRTHRRQKLCSVSVSADGAPPELLHSAVMNKKKGKGEHIYAVMRDSIPEELLGRIVAAISDGDSTAQKANRLLQQEVHRLGGSCKTVVCGAHSISRCLNDCLGSRVVKKKEQGFEFEYVLTKLKSVLTQIRNTDYMCETLCEKQRSCNLPELTIPRACITRYFAIPMHSMNRLPHLHRWTTVHKLFQFVLNNKDALLLLNADDRVSAACPGLTEIFEPAFWKIVLALLPFVNATHYCDQLIQSDMSTCGFILPTLDYIIEASKTSKKEMPSTSSKQKMQAVTNRIQARYEHYLAHEGGWLAAATVLTPIFHANEVPKKVKSFVPVVQKVKKAAAAFLKKEGGVQLSACLIEFLGKVDPFADEEFWYLAAKKTPCTWWRLIGQGSPLSCEALKLSCMPCHLSPATILNSEQVSSLHLPRLNAHSPSWAGFPLTSGIASKATSCTSCASCTTT